MTLWYGENETVKTYSSVKFEFNYLFAGDMSSYSMETLLKLLADRQNMGDESFETTFYRMHLFVTYLRIRAIKNAILLPSISTNSNANEVSDTSNDGLEKYRVRAVQS